MGVAVGIVSLCALELYIIYYAWGHFTLPVADKRRKITVAGTRINTFFDQSTCTSIIIFTVI